MNPVVETEGEEVVEDVAEGQESVPSDTESPADEPPPAPAVDATNAMSILVPAETEAAVQADVQPSSASIESETAEETTAAPETQPTAEPDSAEIVATDLPSLTPSPGENSDTEAVVDSAAAEEPAISPAPTPPAVLSPAPTAPAQYGTYVIQQGDTLRNIAGRYGTTVAVLVELNQMTNPDVVVVGKEIKVPAIR